MSKDAFKIGKSQRKADAKHHQPQNDANSKINKTRSRQTFEGFQGLRLKGFCQLTAPQRQQVVVLTHERFNSRKPKSSKPTEFQRKCKRRPYLHKPDARLILLSRYLHPKVNSQQPTATMKISAFYIAEEIQLKQLKENHAGVLLQENPSELYYKLDEEGYFYASDYGAVVFANISDADLNKHLQFLQPYCGRILSEKLRDDVEIIHRPNEALSFGFDNLGVPELSEGVIKIVMLNLAYSVAMDFYTQRAQEQLVEIQQFTKQMELEGTIHISRKNMVRFIGRALNNKNRIVENLFIFDSPDLAWDDEYLDRIHRGMARTFEIQLRFKELEYNFKVIEDNLAVFRDFFLHRESSKLEWIIIVLICIEVFDLILSKVGKFF